MFAILSIMYVLHMYIYTLTLYILLYIYSPPQGEDGSDDLYQPNEYALAGEQYEFSTDVEVHSLEKKMRSVGHTLAKRGVDVEQMFKVYYIMHIYC